MPQRFASLTNRHREEPTGLTATAADFASPKPEPIDEFSRRGI